MAVFEQAYSKTLSHEGGYVDDPLDSGGETYKGIARNHHPKWRGWNIIDAFKDIPRFPHNLASSSDLKSLVKTFYKKGFWETNKLSCVPQPIANEVFDTGVNMGAVTAARILQKALNLLNRNGKTFPELVVDGKIGGKTLAAIKACDLSKLNTTLNLLQGERYMNIVRKNPKQERFFNGWLNRVSIIKTK